jgi:hypothetical protein
MRICLVHYVRTKRWFLMVFLYGCLVNATRIWLEYFKHACGILRYVWGAKSYLACPNGIGSGCPRRLESLPFSLTSLNRLWVLVGLCGLMFRSFRHHWQCPANCRNCCCGSNGCHSMSGSRRIRNYCRRCHRMSGSQRIRNYRRRLKLGRAFCQSRSLGEGGNCCGSGSQNCCGSGSAVVYSRNLLSRW